MVVLDKTTSETYMLNVVRYETSKSSKMRGRAKNQIDKYFAAVQKIQNGSTQKLKKKSTFIVNYQFASNAFSLQNQIKLTQENGLRAEAT